MRIGVDCHVLAGMFQGSRTYILNLYNEVLKLNTKHDFYFFGNWRENEKPFGDSPTYVNFSSTSKLKRLTYETAILIKKYRIDAYHSNYISPLILPCKSILTIHDILFESHPQYFTNFFVLRSKVLVRLSALRADIIHTVSNFSKNEIQKRYNIESQKIHLVPNGVDKFKFTPEKKSEAVDIIKKKYGIQDFILAVGRLEPRKNHLNLIMAFQRLTDKLQEKYKLVIIGQKDFHFQTAIDYINSNNLQNNIIILENIDDNFLPLFYKAAEIFVYPSFAEGFGIPIIEAMSSGTPTISSNTTSMPEVIGNAGILANPNDIESLTETMCMLLTDSVLKASYSKTGSKQAKKYNWTEAAVNYLKSINDL